MKMKMKMKMNKYNHNINIIIICHVWILTNRFRLKTKKNHVFYRSFTVLLPFVPNAASPATKHKNEYYSTHKYILLSVFIVLLFVLICVYLLYSYSTLCKLYYQSRLVFICNCIWSNIKCQYIYKLQFQ